MRRLALALVVITAAGCGDSGVSIQDAPELFLSEYCQYLARCGLVPSASECEHMNIGLTLAIDPSLQAAIDAGKVKYDGSTLESCYKQIGSFTCDKTDENGRQFGGGDCRTAIHGTVADGGQCAIDDECKSGTCDVPQCPDACCQGTCAASDGLSYPRHAGQACQSTVDCDTNTYCDGTSRVCIALKAAGATCLSTNECDFGLGCAGTPRVCKALPKLGEACPDGTCRDEGQYCPQATMTCTKLGLPGDACMRGSDCSSFYTCDATMHCALGPHEGEACMIGTRCADSGNFCDTTTMTCKSRQANGAACTSNSQCESNYCDNTGTTSTCADEPVCI